MHWNFFVVDTVDLEVRDGLPEGRGVFTKQMIPAGTSICEYGGKFYTKKEALEKNILEGTYLLEFRYKSRFDQKNKTGFLCPSSDQDLTIGMLLNHSKAHFTTTKKVFVDCEGLPHIWFHAVRDLPAGTELSHNYDNPYYEGVNKCLSSCTICGKSVFCFRFPCFCLWFNLDRDLHGWWCFSKIFTRSGSRLCPTLRLHMSTTKLGQACCILVLIVKGWG